MSDTGTIRPPADEPPKVASGLGNVSVGPVSRGPSSDSLFSGGLCAVAAALLYYAYSSKVEDPIHLYLGLLIIVGGALPGLLWAKRDDRRFPVFEVLMLTTINTYAVPLLSGHQSLQFYSADTITRSAVAVLMYLLVANVTYAMTTGRPKRTRNWTEEIISNNIADYLAYGMILTTAYTMITLLTEWIPYDLNGPIRAVCYGVGIISTFIQARMWGQGTLPHSRKASFVVQLTLQVVFSWAALFLIGGISILALALLGYVSGGKKLPIIALVIVLPIVSVLHNGKSMMREKYWEGGAPAPTLSEIPAFYSEWIGYALDPATSDDSAERKRRGSKLLERTSLFHILCLVVDNTPERQPYLDGHTYSFIPGQFVPTFFWKGKPPSHAATYYLSIYYGLQSSEDTLKTTIAFGMLSEAFANFGFIGVAMLGAVFGFVLKKIGDWSTYSPILSYPGLLLVVLMAWSFQSELTMAAWLSSLYQACFAVLGVPFIMRNFLGR